MTTVLFIVHLPFDEVSKVNKALYSGSLAHQSKLEEKESEEGESDEGESEEGESDDEEYVKINIGENVEITKSHTDSPPEGEEDNKDKVESTVEENEQNFLNTVGVAIDKTKEQDDSDQKSKNEPEAPVRKKRKKRKNQGKLYNRFLSYDFTGVAVNIIKKNDIKKAVWQKTDGGEYWQVTFPMESKNSDNILNQLLTAGIGNNNFSSISIVPVTVNFPATLLHGLEDEAQEKSNLEPKKEQFFQSIKSRLTVAQVIDVVRAGSQLTFDYVMLIIMASVISAVGLVENSPVLLVASMLVSPLMGPILGGTFGIVLRYKSLWKPGILNELLGLTICVVAGFIFGIICGFGVPGWSKVTEEMASRGAARSLYVGVIVAIPSGAGVALSILGGNSGSLVGVAISASLLPPAVNAGIFWAYAIINAATESTNTTLVAPEVKVNLNDYTSSELGEMGAVSVTLTIVNIVIIFLMGVIILKVKEVAPHTGTAVTKGFWKKDLKTTREYLRAHTMDNSRKIGDAMLVEWGQLQIPGFTNMDTIKPEVGARITQDLKKHIKALEDDFGYNGVIGNLPGVSGRVIQQLFDALPVESGPASRFQVTKAYNRLGATEFHSNSRFMINALNENDDNSMAVHAAKVKARKKSNVSEPLLLSADTAV